MPIDANATLMTTATSSPASCAARFPRSKVYEDEHALAFHDINPLAPVHILVIPKGAYVSWDDFSERASDAEIAGFVRAVGQVARERGPGRARAIACSPMPACNSGQEVPHLHVHIFGGAAARADARALSALVEGGLPSRAEPLGFAPQSQPS